MTTEQNPQDSTNVPLNDPLASSEQLAKAKAFYVDNHEKTTGEPLELDTYLKLSNTQLLKQIADALNQNAL
jgi:hypothetical protein